MNPKQQVKVSIDEGCGLFGWLPLLEMCTRTISRRFTEYDLLLMLDLTLVPSGLVPAAAGTTVQ